MTDNIPAGLSNITADGGAEWQITITPGANGTTVQATYTGPYPIEPGTTLPEVRVTGTINRLTMGSFINGANVTARGSSGVITKKGSSTIAVGTSQPATPTPQPPGGAPGLPPTGSGPLAPAPEQ